MSVVMNEIAALLATKGIAVRETAPYGGRPTITFFDSTGSAILDWPEPALMKAYCHLFYNC